MTETAERARTRKNEAQVSIRAMEPEDLAGVNDLLNQPRAVWGTLQRPYTSRAERERKSESWRPTLQLVAEIDGCLGPTLAGTASLERLTDRRAHAARLGMAVHDRHAGRGVGTALLGAVVDYADKWLGVTRIELSVWPDNDRAVRLYERHGFEREGLHKAYALRDGAYVDSMSMARVRGH